MLRGLGNTSKVSGGQGSLGHLVVGVIDLKRSVSLWVVSSFTDHFFFFFFLSSTYIAVYSKQSARYSNYTYLSLTGMKKTPNLLELPFKRGLMGL